MRISSLFCQRHFIVIPAGCLTALDQRWHQFIGPLFSVLGTLQGGPGRSATESAASFTGAPLLPTICSCPAGERWPRAYLARRSLLWNLRRPREFSSMASPPLHWGLCGRSLCLWLGPLQVVLRVRLARAGDEYFSRSCGSERMFSRIDAISWVASVSRYYGRTTMTLGAEGRLKFVPRFRFSSRVAGMFKSAIGTFLVHFP